MQFYLHENKTDLEVGFSQNLIEWSPVVADCQLQGSSSPSLRNKGNTDCPFDRRCSRISCTGFISDFSQFVPMPTAQLCRRPVHTFETSLFSLARCVALNQWQCSHSLYCLIALRLHMAVYNNDQTKHQHCWRCHPSHGRHRQAEENPCDSNEMSWIHRKTDAWYNYQKIINLPNPTEVSSSYQ